MAVRGGVAVGGFPVADRARKRFSPAPSQPADMAQPEDTLRESPIDFDTAVAYALHPEMRRLLILYVVGAVLLPVGLSMFGGSFVLAPGVIPQLVSMVAGLLVTVVAAVFFFAGLIGAVFKLVADANIIAARA